MAYPRKIATILRKTLDRIYNTLPHIYGEIAKLFHVRKMRVLIIPTDAPASLGDEAMLIAAICHYNTNKYEVHVLDYSPTNSWKPLIPSYAYLHSGFDFFKKRKGQFKLARLFLRSKKVIVLGADTVDGKYGPWHAESKCKLLRLASSCGSECRMSGFSYNNTPSRESIKHFHTLKNATFALRDPESKKRFTQATKFDSILSADCAFLLKPEATSQSSVQALDWIKQQKALGCSKMIGINLHSLIELTSEIPNLTHSLSQSLKSMIESLLRQDQTFRFILLPHDERNYSEKCKSDETTLKALQNSIEAHHRERCLLLKFPITAQDIKAIVSQVDLVITARMHLAIAALGTKTPVLGITYQDKFEGLYSHFGLTRMTIAPQEATNDELFLEFVSQALARLDETSELISKKLPHIHSLAQKNFPI